MSYFTQFVVRGIAARQCLRQNEIPLDEKLAKVVAADSQLLNCVYWCVAGLVTLGHELPLAVRKDVEEFYEACRRDDGFAQSYMQAAHILATVSGVQISKLLNLPTPQEGIRDAVWSLRVETGAFVAYKGGEEDVRFAYAALLSLHLCGGIDFPSLCSRDDTVAWIRRCQNVDGGFGSTPGAESHAGHTFCAVAALCLLKEALTGKHYARCCRWLLSRQVTKDQKPGGLNGRVGKEADSCYTFWVLASAKLLGMPLNESFDIKAIREFLESCKKEDGIAKDPTHHPDPFHSFFAMVGDKLIDDEFDALTALPRSILQ